MVRLKTSSSPAQLRKLTPRARARRMSAGVIDVAPCDARPSRQTGLPNAAAGRRRKGAAFSGIAAALGDGTGMAVAVIICPLVFRFIDHAVAAALPRTF